MSMPKDREDECNAHFYIFDNQGDGCATMRCQLPKGHEGLHRETFIRKDTDSKKDNRCVVTWETDERCWHDWVELSSDEGKKLFLSIIGEDGDEEDQEWCEEYKNRLLRGDRYICRQCLFTSYEQTSQALVW